MDNSRFMIYLKLHNIFINKHKTYVTGCIENVQNEQAMPAYSAVDSVGYNKLNFVPLPNQPSLPHYCSTSSRPDFKRNNFRRQETKLNNNSNIYNGFHESGNSYLTVGQAKALQSQSILDNDNNSNPY